MGPLKNVRSNQQLRTSKSTKNQKTMLPTCKNIHSCFEQDFPYHMYSTCGPCWWSVLEWHAGWTSRMLHVFAHRRVWQRAGPPTGSECLPTAYQALQNIGDAKILVSIYLLKWQSQFHPIHCFRIRVYRILDFSIISEATIFMDNNNWCINSTEKSGFLIHDRLKNQHRLYMSQLGGGDWQGFQVSRVYACGLCWTFCEAINASCE